MKITLDDGHVPVLDSERKSRPGNWKKRRGYKPKGIGPAHLKGIAAPVPGTPITIFGDVLPCQVEQTPGWKAEKSLMAAILKDAVDLYKLGLATGRRQTLTEARDAEAWLRSNDVHWVFSFLNICEVLNLDSDWLRAGLFARKEAA